VARGTRAEIKVLPLPWPKLQVTFYLFFGIESHYVAQNFK
jgi:hypothetical protein